MSKKDKFLQKALNSLQMIWNSDEPGDSIQDIKNYIRGQESLRQETLDLISTAQQNIETINTNIENCQMLIDQAEIEKIKAMNPRAKDVFKVYQ